MKVFPAVHYSMGGLWVDYEKDARGSLKTGSPRNHSTNIPGLYAVGEVDFAYHGANRLGANSLLSCIWGGMATGPAVPPTRTSRRAFDLPSHFDKAQKSRRRSTHQENQTGEAERPSRLHPSSNRAHDCTIERTTRPDKLLARSADG
jgi:succinate dehydrogenase / fumarate reductase flavoprotein subunit